MFLILWPASGYHQRLTPSARRTASRSPAHVGEIWGTGLRKPVQTGAESVEWTAPMVNKINNLDSMAELRTKGSWVRFLPAAPEKQEMDQRLRGFLLLGRFSLRGEILGTGEFFGRWTEALPPPSSPVFAHLTSIDH